MLRAFRYALIVLPACLAGLSMPAAAAATATESNRNIVVRNADAPVSEKRIALVIGNSTYKSSPLANPANDASDVAAKLGKLGFEVILKTNVGLRDMSRAVTQFGQKLSPGSVALFYYAGHGIQAKGRNFLVPVDAEIDQETSIRSEAMDVDQILEQLQPARVSLVILDACRNNPFEHRFRSAGGGGLAQMDAPKGTLIAYATAPGKVAMDGTGRNGLYTAELLKAMNAPDRRIEDLFKQVRSNVANATSDQQVPWESSSLTGDLYLSGTHPATTATATVAAPAKPQGSAVASPSDAAAFELEFWRSVEKAGKPEDYKAYLSRYPRGQFVELAKARLVPQETATASPPASRNPVSVASTNIPPAASATPLPAATATTADSVRDELEQATRLLKAGSIRDARIRFKALSDSIPENNPLHRHAVYGLGLAQAASLMCREALKTLGTATESWPSHKMAPVAWRDMALCEKTLNHPFKAVHALKTLTDKYPNSEEAEWARRQLQSKEFQTAKLFQRQR